MYERKYPWYWAVFLIEAHMCMRDIVYKIPYTLHIIQKRKEKWKTETGTTVRITVDNLPWLVGALLDQDQASSRKMDILKDLARNGLYPGRQIASKNMFNPDGWISSNTINVLNPTTTQTILGSWTTTTYTAIHNKYQSWWCIQFTFAR